MMGNRKLKSRPSGGGSVEDFISGATSQTMEQPKPAADPAMPGEAKARHGGRLPWEKETVRADVIKQFALRLPEPYFLKLKYIAEQTPDSMQKFCQDALRSAINEKLRELAARDK